MARRINLKDTYPRKQREKTSILVLSVALVLVLMAIVIKVNFNKNSQTETPALDSSTVDVAADTNAVQEKTNTESTELDNNGNTENLIFVEVPRNEENEEKSGPDYPFTIVDTKPEPTWFYGDFELPISGATGWASVQLKMYSEKSTSNSSIATLVPGTSFLILEEDENWLKIKTSDELIGFVKKSTVLINLPDIIPSIIYTDTNSQASLFRSSGVELGGITGTQLYDVYRWNERLQREQFDMPVIFDVAYKVMAAQRAALKEGYSLRVFESFRPLETQQQISQSLKSLSAVNSSVKKGLKLDTWGLGWFIATNVSNHQRGIALDLSLVQVDDFMVYISGPYTYRVVSEFTELTMPTQMHELSASAVRYKSPYSREFSQFMNENAKLLHKFCTDAGFSPLASEWWHFNDVETQNALSKLSDGNFFLEPNVSVEP